jgi:iron-sulfur cluster assembly accessory protein
MQTIPVVQDPISLTEQAAQMVRKAMADEGLKDHGLRVGVMGGGCSGLQYMLDFAPAAVEDDLVSEQHGIAIYVDPYSASHLSGTRLNYVDGLHGSGFKFENPNIVRACGCGSSFTT